MHFNTDTEIGDIEFAKQMPVDRTSDTRTLYEVSLFIGRLSNEQEKLALLY